MPVSNPAASSSGAGQQVPDTQTLVTLLGGLMPLLLRLQASPFGQPFGPGQFGAPIPAPNPALDHQAAVSFVEDITADSLHALSSYLEAHDGRQDARYAGLESCAPILAQAQQCLAARDYAQAFALIWQAYRVIAAMRIVNPQLPPVRRRATTDGAEAAVH
jgi:hypothetical protein